MKQCPGARPLHINNATVQEGARANRAVGKQFNFSTNYVFATSARSAADQIQMKARCALRANS